MVQLQDLPTEILTQCFSYIGQSAEEVDYDEPDDVMEDDYVEGDDEDLSNLCLVSRKLRDIAQPLLFANFEDLDIDGGLKRLTSFTKVIISHPELAEYVQSIRLMPLSLERSKPSDRKLPAEDLRLFTQAIRALQVPSDQEKAWLTDLEFRDFTVLLALLLCKTPKLRELSLPGPMVLPKTTDYLFARAPPCLPNLNRLRIQAHPDVIFPFGIHMIEKFCSRLSVKALDVQNGVLTDGNFPASWTPNSLPLEDINLFYCDVDRKSITKLLQACRSVKSFVWSNWSTDLQLEDCLSHKTMDFDGSHLHAMLLPHKATLKNLQLQWGDLWDTDENGVYRPESPRAKFPSFRDFTALEELYISHRLLPPNPEFPPSLKILIVGDCNTSIREWTRKFAADVHNGRYPALRNILVMSRDLKQTVMLPGQLIPPGEEPFDSFQSLQNLFKGTQVEYTIMPYNIKNLLRDNAYDDSDDLQGGIDGMNVGPRSGYNGFYDEFDEYDDEFYEYNYDSDSRPAMRALLMQTLRDHAMDASGLPPWYEAGIDEVE